MQLNLMPVIQSDILYSMKKLILIILFSVLAPLVVFGEGVADKQVSSSVYLLHLYFDNGQLFADRDVQFKYDILSETFVPEILATQFPYKGEVVNLKGEVAATFQFDPRQGNPKFLKGKISVKAPYVPDGQKVNFYNTQGNQLLSIFVSESSFCNDDGVCNSAVGEDTKTCPSDCKTATPVPTIPAVLPGSGGASGVLQGLIYLIIGLGLAGGFWWWKKRKSSQTMEFPSNLPSPPSPQNSA